MGLGTRLRRLEERIGPPPEPGPELTPEELAKRLEWWIGQQTYYRGVFDEDPAFGPAWSHYHRLWGMHTHGWSPLHAVWLPREPPEFEEARLAILPIMLGVLERQPRPVRLLGRVLAALAAAAASADPVANRPSAG